MAASEYTKEKSTVTITFGDQAENHVGMQKLGKSVESGFSVKELEDISTKLVNSELIRLNENLPEDIKTTEAAVLIIRSKIDNLQNYDNLFNELTNLDIDKKAFMYGRVVNKHARHNLCFDEFDQEPDYKNGKGRILSFNKLPLLKKLREDLPKMFGSKANKLVAEGNYYYDANKCGIGFHGDSERKIVIAIRLGKSIPLHYQWFVKGNPIGYRKILTLNHGDIYIMSDKAVGYDWKTKKEPTLRHAAGAEKFLTIK